MFFNNESTKFYGIADTKETIINSDEAVEIKEIAVVQGQKVSIGDTLVVLDQPELKIMINEISHMLDDYKAQKKVQTTFSRSEMQKYKAEQEERISEITKEIRELETQYELNKKLVDELRSIKRVNSSGVDSINPILTQIQSLRRLLESAKRTPEVEIERLSQELSNQDNPITAQIRRYEEELGLLLKRQKELVKVAQINGIIGMVKFKEGEKVSPFDTILTLHAAAPSYVRGYIHEDLISGIAIGDSVWVFSVGNDKKSISGSVIGIGTRIVLYPERLRKRIDVPVWGREVIIKLPEHSGFILGQKVLISTSKKKFPFFFHKDKEKCTDRLTEISNMKMTDIVVDQNLVLSPIEASGITYLADLQSFLIVSDDTDDKRPDLFLMDPQGRIKHRFSIQGLPKINDMESIISHGPQNLYVLSSQSYNNKGKQPKDRKLFARIKREGNSFIHDGSVHLFDLLIDAALKDKSAAWSDFIQRCAREQSIDIEGMTVYNDSLLLGFKNPKIGNEAVILAISNFNEMLDSNKLDLGQVTIWRTLPLYDNTKGVFCGISDLITYNDIIYGVSTGVSSRNGLDEDVGLYWRYSPQTGALKIIQSFKDIKPEGISLTGEAGTFCIVFDNGVKNPSQFIFVKDSD